MTRDTPRPEVPLAHVQLGDLVVLPNGQALTTRCRVDLPTPSGSMAGFLIMGEMQNLLSIPPSASSPVNVYVPIDHLPVDPRQCREVHSGVARYWAPHLPSISGAMGEIGFRVMEVRGSVDPIVLVYRGHELIVFVRASFAWGDDLQVLYMDRSDANDQDVVRHAAVVNDPTLIPDELAVEERRSLYESFT